MTTRTFAPWVEPFAAADREACDEFLLVAHSIQDEAWARSSPLEGWTYKDLLAHVAGGSGGVFRYIVQNVVNGGPLDPARVGDASGADAANASDVEDRRHRSVEELIREFESKNDERQELLSKISEAHRDLRQDEYPITFGEFLSRDPGGHVREHLAQLRTASEVA